MLITLVFSVAAMKSRTFFSFPYSASEQVCRSWEGVQPDSWLKLASGNIPYHGCPAQFMSGGWPGGRKWLFSFLWVRIFSCLGVWTLWEILWN